MRDVDLEGVALTDGDEEAHQMGVGPLATLADGDRHAHGLLARLTSSSERAGDRKVHTGLGRQRLRLGEIGLGLMGIVTALGLGQQGSDAVEVTHRVRSATGMPAPSNAARSSRAASGPRTISARSTSSPQNSGP